MIVYNISSGVILAKIPKGQPYDYLGEGNSHIILNDYPSNIFNHLVINNELIAMTDIEVRELQTYGKILLPEERFENEMLNKLTPSHDEIRKAENTIEILSLLSEVL